jgi:hypothetical protein
MTTNSEFIDLAPIDRFRYLEMILINPAYAYATMQLTSIHTELAISAPDAETREQSRQRILAVRELVNLFDQEYANAKDALRQNGST